jgi:hypothetical protein
MWLGGVVPNGQCEENLNSWYQFFHAVVSHPCTQDYKGLQRVSAF